MRKKGRPKSTEQRRERINYRAKKNGMVAREASQEMRRYTTSPRTARSTRAR